MAKKKAHKAAPARSKKTETDSEIAKLRDAPMTDENVKKLSTTVEENRTIEQLCFLADGLDGVEDEEHTITLHPDQGQWLSENGVELEDPDEYGDTPEICRVKSMALVEAMRPYQEDMEVEDGGPAGVMRSRSHVGAVSGPDRRTQEGKTASASAQGSGAD
jgi:hypothetical protein